MFAASLLYIVLVFRWYNTFSEGRESIRDKQRSGRRTTTRIRKNIARVVDILMEDRWSSCRLIAEQMGIPRTVVQQILRENLQKWKLCVWFVPHPMTNRMNSALITLTTLLKRSKATQTFWTL